MSKTEVEYTKAKLSKRMLAYILDIGLVATFSVIFFALVNLIVTNTDGYKQLDGQITEIRNESGLYIEGTDILTYTKDEAHFTSYESRKNFLSSHIDSFYNNTNFFDAEKSIKTINEYNKRKLNAVTDNVHLFKEESGVIVESAVEPEKLYNFYCTEISDYSYSYLFYNQTYTNLIKSSFWIVIGEVAGCATIMFTIAYLVFPLWIFKRGRQTPGMKMAKVGLISYHAVNVTPGIYVGQFFFELIIVFYLSFFSFLIPAIVSISMTFIGKTSPSLASYVFNNYFVDVKNQDIYLDEVERKLAEDTINKASIENKDFIIK